MSNILEELMNIPEWNQLGNQLKKEFSYMEDEEIKKINEKGIREILSDDLLDEALNLATVLVMKKINQDLMQQGKDEFDYFVKKLTGEN